MRVIGSVSKHYLRKISQFSYIIEWSTLSSAIAMCGPIESPQRPDEIPGTNQSNLLAAFGLFSAYANGQNDGTANQVVNRSAEAFLPSLLVSHILLEPGTDQVSGRSQGSTGRSDKVQDLLIKLLEGQIVVRRKDGQSELDAINEAKTELARMLSDLKAERERHEIGPATRAAFARFEELYGQRAFRSTRAVKLTLEEAMTEAGLAKFERQAETYTEMRRRANQRQDQLISFLPAYVRPERRLEETDDAYIRRCRQEVEKRAAELKLEREQGVWGPKSQEAYKQYLKWFHETALPGVMGDLDALALPWPVNCPERLNMGMAGRAENPEVFRAMYAAGRRIGKDNSDPVNALEDTAYFTFGSHHQWFKNALEMVADVVAFPRSEELKQLIVKEKLPSGWLEGADTDPKRWRARAAEMLDLSIQVRNLFEAMDHLHRENKDFPFIPPPGTFFERNADGSIARNADGTIKAYGLRLPPNLRDDESNNRIAQDLRDWVAAHQERTVTTIAGYRHGLANPEQLLSFTNMPIYGRLARINANGELVGIASPNEPERDGETRRRFNLLECRCYVEVAREGPNAGREVIVQTVEARDIPTFGYQNWVGPTVATMPRREIPLEKSKFYAVLRGSNIELVKGDKLESVLNSQRRWLRAEQIITPTVDALLLASTFGEGFAAVRAARAAEGAARLTVGECWKEFGKLGLKTVMVGAGIYHSAGGHETAFGRLATQARGLFFVGDISLGLSRTLGLLSVPDSVRKMQAAVDNSRWLWLLHSGTHGKSPPSPTAIGFRASEFCFLPFIYRDLRHLGEMAVGSNIDVLRDASVILGDGTNYRAPERGSREAHRPEVARQELEILGRYVTLLGEGRDPATQEKVRTILERTQELLRRNQELLGPDAKPEDRQKLEQDREKFKKELLNHFLLERRTMESLIKRHGMSDADLRELHDPALLMKRWTENGVAAEVERRNSEIGPDVRAAAAIALLSLSRQPDYSLPSELVTERRTYTVRGANGRPTTRSYTVGISAQELYGYLKRDMALPEQHSRGIVTGEVLVRHGALTGQRYAGTLLNVLQDPNSTPRDRMAALSDPFGPRFATIIDGLKGLDEVGAIDLGIGAGDGFGLNARSLQEALRRTAKQDSNPDVRAMATMVLYGLNHPDRSTCQAILQQNNARWQALSGREAGTYAREVRAYLESQCAVEIPALPAAGADQQTVSGVQAQADLQRGVRLNAALRLWELSADNADEQKRLARIMASCFSPTDARVSVQVIEALWPDRIKHLEAAEVASLRKQAVDLLSVPALAPGANADALAVAERQAAAMARLVRHIPVVIGDQQPELTRLFCNRLEQMLDPRAVSRMKDLERSPVYAAIRHTERPMGTLPEAASFPALRVEAIRALTSQGSQSSVPLIRARLSGDISFYDKPFPRKVDTSDPNVRIEAARALALLQDRVWLCENLPNLIAREVDPAVAQVLRDVQARFPAPNTPTRAQLAQERFDEARYQRERPKACEEQGEEQAGRQYLKNEKYALLKGEAFGAAIGDAQESYRYVGTGWYFFFGAGYMFDPLYERQRIDRAVQKTKEREEQWQTLVNAAKKIGPEAEQAKAALSYILLSDGLHVSPEKYEYVDPENKDNKLTSFQGAPPLSGQGRSWRQRAARSLVDVLINGEDKQKTAYIIEKALTDKDGQVDPETKLILLGGLRWMYQQSNKLIDEAGLSARNSDRHQREIGIPRDHLARLVHQVLEVERTKANRATGTETTQRERLRMELLSDLATYGKYDDRYPILLESARGERSERGRALSWEKFYEFRDGIDAEWNSVPANRNLKLEDGIARVNVAYQAWKKDQKSWMEYLEKFKKNPESAPWRPEVADRRNALVNAIFTGFKGCKFDGTNPVAEAQTLAFLSVLMDDPDGKIRLAAARVLAESPLTIADPYKRRALAFCCELASSDNPEYKKEATAQLAKLKLDKPVSDYVSMFSALELDELRQVSQLLTAVSKHHPDDAIKQKAAEITEKLWQKLCRDVSEGRNTLNGNSLKADDPLVPLLEQALKDTTLTETQRLNVGRLLTSPENAQLPNQKLNAAAYAQIGLTSGSTTTRLDVARDILSEAKRNLFSQPDRTQALKTIIDLAADDESTRASASSVLLANKEMALSALEQINKTFDGKPRREIAKLEAELGLVPALYKACGNNPKAEASLYESYIHAQRHLGDDNTVTKQLLSLLDRSTRESGHTRINNGSDPRIQQMRLALRNSNPELRYYAALALMEAEGDSVEQAVRMEARAVVFDRIKAIAAEAKQLESSSQDHRAIGRAWARVEKIFDRIDPEGAERENSYSYHYARMRRMVGELGIDTHKDLAPVYLKLADLIEAGQDQRQAERYRQKAKECAGDTSSNAGSDELARLRDRFTAVQRLSQSASQSQDQDEFARAERELRELAAAFGQRLGERSKEVADVMNQLGSQYMAQGRTADGEAAYRVALETYEALGRARMPGQAARSLLGLSRYYASTGNWAAYEECKGKMLDMSRIAGRKEVQLESTRAILDLADYLASDASTQQMSLDAQQLMQHALDVRKKVAGADSVEAADAAMSLAQFYSNPRNPLVNAPMAEQHLAESLRVYARRLGTNNEKWAVAQARLADIYGKSGRWQEGLEAYGAALDAMHNSATIDVNKYREIAFAYRDTIMHYKGFQEVQMLDQMGLRAYRAYQNARRQQPATQPP